MVGKMTGEKTEMPERWILVTLRVWVVKTQYISAFSSFLDFESLVFKGLTDRNVFKCIHCTLKRATW